MLHCPLLLFLSSKGLSSPWATQWLNMHLLLLHYPCYQFYLLLHWEQKSICLFKAEILLFASWSCLILFQLDALLLNVWVIWNPWRRSYSSDGEFEYLPYLLLNIINFINFNLFFKESIWLTTNKCNIRKIQV